MNALTTTGYIKKLYYDILYKIQMFTLTIIKRIFKVIHIKK